jgi:hypothetical protein
VSLAAVAVTVAVRTASVPTVPVVGTLAGLLVYGPVLRQVGFTHAERRLAGTLAERYRVVRQSALERVGQDWRPHDRPAAGAASRRSAARPPGATGRREASLASRRDHVGAARVGIRHVSASYAFVFRVRSGTLERGATGSLRMLAGVLSGERPQTRTCTASRSPPKSVTATAGTGDRSRWLTCWRRRLDCSRRCFSWG